MQSVYHFVPLLCALSSCPSSTTVGRFGWRILRFVADQVLVQFRYGERSLERDILTDHLKDSVCLNFWWFVRTACWLGFSDG
jgi:hypothetical protein